MVDYKELARQARLKILKMIHVAKTSHIASNFSIIDIATVLYQNLKKEDEVVWSAGWKAATIYYFLAEQGKIPKEDLDRFAKEEDGRTEYLGLAEMNVPGVLVNGGSMGHGLPVAVGMALAKKRAGEQGMIYCIMSDGELNEGTTWESCKVAQHHKLNNLIILVDANRWQAMGETKDVLNFEPIEDHFKGFGLHTIRINGHDFFEIENALGKNRGEFPTSIICDTIKGKGVSFMENHLIFHYKHVDDENYKKAMSELQQTDP